MTRQINKTRLKIKMDIEFAKIVKARDGYKCAICGKSGNSYQIHAHHIAGKKCTLLRWDLRNLISLCANHHNLGNGNPSAHHNSIWFSEWMKDNRPEDWKYIKFKKDSIFA